MRASESKMVFVRQDAGEQFADPNQALKGCVFQPRRTLSPMIIGAASRALAELQRPESSATFAVTFKPNCQMRCIHQAQVSNNPVDVPRL